MQLFRPPIRFGGRDNEKKFHSAPRILLDQGTNATRPKQRPKETDQLTFTFVTDGLESAIREAKEAAGDKDVTIIGAASTAQQCLKAGLADELHVDIMPVLLCDGLRLFENISAENIQLERIKVMELAAGRTHLRFRFVKQEMF